MVVTALGLHARQKFRPFFQGRDLEGGILPAAFSCPAQHRSLAFTSAAHPRRKPAFLYSFQPASVTFGTRLRRSSECITDES
ncbi:hypothetical protein RB213_008150 [Colletotrichum asianum]